MVDLHIGSWGLPDFGITEKLQSVLSPSKGTTSQGGSNLFGSSQPSSPTSAASYNVPYSGPQGGKVLGASTSGSTSSQKAATPQQSQQPSFDADAEARAASDRARAENEQRIGQERQAIAGEFDPIFSELDRQLGGLPGQKQELETGIGTLADTQKKSVDQSQLEGMQALDQSAAKEQGNAKGSLRNLEEDVRNLLQAKQFFFGSVGSGDSSAVNQASEAITKGALKSRGAVLGARDAGLGDIETKRQDVRNLSTTQTQKIDQWKAEKLFNITQEFQNKANELNSAKANATGAKAKAINDVVRGLQTDFVNTLRSIDDRAYQFKSSVANWQTQRQAELEDYATKLSMTKSYSSAATPKYSDALNAFNKIYGNGQVDLGQARQATIDQYGIDPLAGLQLDASQTGSKKKSLADSMSDQALQEIFSSQQ